MLWILALTALFAVTAWGFLGNAANRIGLGTYLMRVLNVGVTVANVVTFYLVAVCGGVSVVSLFLLLFLALDWQGASAALLFLLGVGLLIITLPFWGATSTMSKALKTLDEEIKKISLTTLIPTEVANIAGADQALQVVHTIQNGLLKFLSPSAVTQILSTPPRLAYLALLSVVNALDRMFRIVVSMVIWIMVIGFGILYLPEGFRLGQVIVVLMGIGIIFFINLYKGWLTDKPFRQSIGALRLAVLVAVVFIIIPPLEHAWPEMFLGLDRYAEASRESTTVGLFGPDYDQHKMVASKRTNAFQVDANGQLQARIIGKGTPLWRVPDSNFQLLSDGRRYFACWLESTTMAGVPDPSRGQFLVPGDAL